MRRVRVGSSSGRLRALVAAAALTVLASACGSTVQQVSGEPGAVVGDGGPDGVTATTGSGSDGLAVPGSGPAAAMPAAGTAPPAGGVTSASTGVGSSVASSSGASGGGGPAGGTAPAGGPTGAGSGADGLTDPGSTAADGGGPAVPPGTRGVTDEAIEVGVITVNGFSAAAGALGVGAVPGDGQQQAQIVIDHLNAQGGGAGRTYQPVFHDVDPTGNKDVTGQAACADLTQDRPVFAAVSLTGLGESFYGCMRQAAIPVVAAGETADAAWYAQFPDLYQPMDVDLTRRMRAVAEGLHPLGFFDGGWAPAGGTTTKVGIFALDDPRAQRAVDEGLLPALQSLGVEVAARFAYSAVGQEGNAVLQFRTAGVTHVIPVYASPLLLAQAAESQGYRPRYGLESRASMGTLQTVLPASQLEGAMGVGWNPYNDVDAARDPGFANDRQELCDQLMRDGGVDMGNRVTALSATWTCDMLFFLDEVVERSSELSASGFRTAAEGLGRAYPPVSTFVTELSPGQGHDGAAVWRPVSFLADCSCFTYTGEPRDLPR